MPNKPNSSTADCGLRTRDRPAAGWPAASGLRRPVVQTNPIGQREPCQTKPISPGWPGPGGPMVRNKPNFGKLVGWAGGAAVQTNPIRRPACGEAKAGRRPGQRRPPRGNCAKQTQFPATPGGSRRGVCRAKQSQFFNCGPGSQSGVTTLRIWDRGLRKAGGSGHGLRGRLHKQTQFQATPGRAGRGIDRVKQSQFPGVEPKR